MKSKALDAINEDLMICVGIGATMSCGSDRYPYYVSEVLPKGVVGLYRPKACFDEKHPWEGGDQVVDPFDPKQASAVYIKRRYGHWWQVESNGNPIRRFTSRYERLRFGSAHSYRDPSF